MTATDKRILLVTGGSRGIGAAIARQGAAEGYSVCVNYRSNRDAAEAVVADITAAGGTAVAIRADVSVEGEVVRLFEQIDGTLGRLTALVNNAGILERQARVEEMDAARIGRVFSSNVTGSFICCREAVRRMSTRHGGSGGAIVNVSSRAACLGAPGEYVDYAASKAAIDTLTIGLAKEVAAEGIRVNAVCPGIIYTDIHASGGEPGRVERLKDSIPMKRAGIRKRLPGRYCGFSPMRRPTPPERCSMWRVGGRYSAAHGVSLSRDKRAPYPGDTGDKDPGGVTKAVFEPYRSASIAPPWDSARCRTRNPRSPGRSRRSCQAPWAW